MVYYKVIGGWGFFFFFFFLDVYGWVGWLIGWNVDEKEKEKMARARFLGSQLVAGWVL